MGGRRGWRAGWAPPAVAGAAVALAGLIGGARALLWSDTPVMEVDADWFRKRLYNKEETKYTVAYVHKTDCPDCARAKPLFEQVARAGEGLWESVSINGPLHNDFLEFADLAGLSTTTKGEDGHAGLPHPHVVLFVSKGKKYRKFVYGEEKSRVKKGKGKATLNLTPVDITKFIMKHVTDRAVENNPINQKELDEFLKDRDSWFQMRDARLNKEQTRREDRQRKKRREEAKKAQDAANKKAKKEAAKKAGLFKHSDAVLEFDERSWLSHPMNYMDHTYKPTMVFMYKAKDEASRNISSAYQTLAAKYKGKAVLGTFNCDYNKDLCKDKEGADASIPSFIRHVPDLYGDEVGGISYIPFEGNHTLEELDADIHAMLTQLNFYPEVRQLTNGTMWNEHCVDHKDICYIAFLPDLSGSSIELRNAYITELEDAAEEAGLPHRRGYFWSEAGAQPDLEDAFSVGSQGYPSLFALSPKKHGFATYEGAFEASGFEGFFTRLMRTQIKPVDRSSIGIMDIRPWNGQMPEVLEDEFSLDDIMGTD